MPGCSEKEMVDITSPKNSASFVLRLWLETREAGSPEWRWQVHHVQTGDKRYFHSLTDVLEFVGECSGVEPPQTAVRDRVT